MSGHEKNRSDILVIGGGVIGLTTAYFLARQGVSVSLIDRQQTGREASWAGAGMLPPGNLSGATTAEARLRSYSFNAWQKLSAELHRQTKIDNGYVRCGAIEVPPLNGDFASQIAEWKAEGIVVEDFNRQQLERHLPDLHEDFQAGVFLPDFGQARNPRHVKALASACRMLGVEIIEHATQVRLEKTKTGGVTASLPDRQFLADRVCVCAGAWSSQVLEGVGVVLPVRPVHGQIVQLKVSQLPFTCVVEQGRRYVVPRADGLILIGSTEEHTGFEKRNTSEGVSGLLKFAESLVPELGKAEVVRCWSGLRPGSPDELPFLGRVDSFTNLFVAAGHFRSGLQMSAGTGRIMADVLTGKLPEIDLDGLTFERQQKMKTTPIG